MTIYLDLLFIINFFFDLILLVSVKLILKRNVKTFRLLLASLVGALSIFLLFLKISSFELFLIKIFISILMIVIAFGYKDKNYFGTNFLFLYIVSIVLGGFLYFLNMQFSYKNEGLVFFYKGISINIIFLIIITPIFLFLYINQLKKLKSTFNNYYDITIVFSNNKKINLTGFVDTGNKLKDPYFNRPIILIEEYILKNKVSLKKPILVPYYSLNNKNLLKCIKIKELVINNKKNTNLLVGIAEEKFNINGVSCILHPKVMEELK